MTKLIVCVLLVDDDEKAGIQELLRASMPIQDGAIVQAASVQEMWKAVAQAVQPAQSVVSTPTAEATILRVRELTIDKARRIVKLGKEELHLTPTEYDLICLLAAQPGTVLSHEQLLHQIWGESNADTLHLLRVNISNLRRKLNRKSGGKGGGKVNGKGNGNLNGNDAGEFYINPSEPQYIATEPGIGYRLRADL